ncbi:MAG TPA: RhuM family protein [Bacilli bacterium]|jgi:prophage maintenance system killer protein|nr:phosphoribosylaminoimidazolesuccinocarboxamide synthase [Acholeplasmataceae bacterium]HNZ77482.1 RhuM family protein [Bacilli bacterium]HOH61353.1 RhuM family protein [Bacilli bacterium]HPM14960.1 RhuM family protein [Bacilli bacterium]HPY54761.1 RhuM family protein [Bacilli bacterium]
MDDKFEVVKFVDNDFELDVRTDKENDTVWLSQKEMALLFNVSTDNIGLHIKNILKDNELDESTTEESSVVQIEGNRKVTRKIKIYNLDMIISTGYRVKSQRGIVFRKWANKVLKDYLIKGYAVNTKRLETLNKVIEVQNRMLASVLNIDSYELEEVIKKYTNALDLLDDYDHHRIVKPDGNIPIYKLEYAEARTIIDSMKFNSNSNLFGVELEKGKLDGILKTIYQDVFNTELYPTIEEKAAHLLYFIVKDHPFIDGCKRIAATLFLEFLNKNKKLVKDGKLVLSNNTLVAITLLTAESKPEEMDVIINVIMHLLNGDYYE